MILERVGFISKLRVSQILGMFPSYCWNFMAGLALKKQFCQTCWHKNSTAQLLQHTVFIHTGQHMAFKTLIVFKWKNAMFKKFVDLANAAQDSHFHALIKQINEDIEEERSAWTLEWSSWLWSNKQTAEKKNQANSRNFRYFFPFCSTPVFHSFLRFDLCVIFWDH